MAHTWHADEPRRRVTFQRVQTPSPIVDPPTPEWERLTIPLILREYERRRSGAAHAINPTSELKKGMPVLLFVPSGHRLRVFASRETICVAIGASKSVAYASIDDDGVTVLGITPTPEALEDQHTQAPRDGCWKRIGGAGIIKDAPLGVSYGILTYVANDAICFTLMDKEAYTDMLDVYNRRAIEEHIKKRQRERDTLEVRQLAMETTSRRPYAFRLQQNKHTFANFLSDRDFSPVRRYEEEKDDAEFQWEGY